ncbi:MAG: branched-chain amino acid transport system II carrier protein [Rickettsiaceae bacterium H1]|nr:branched-chain amino acid transport system II carrier protein [Rickettsiaceae bacterium H1]
MPTQVLNHLIVGFAIFAMFFGAGNLIYPIYIGTKTLSDYPLSILGIALTGVILPFIGLVSITLYRGNVTKFFSGLSNYISLPLIIIILALIGPIAAIPRCIIISFGGFKALLKNTELFWFDLVFCFLLLIAVWYKTKVIEVLGKWLTPILIVGITIIISYALLDENEISSFHQENIGNIQSFFTGAIQGYQTMDLCAAIFFGIIAFDHIKKTSTEENIIKNSIISFSIGLFLLFSVYAFFIYIGEKYSHFLSNIPREQMLIEITRHTIGRFSGPVVAATILIACLTTAIALVNLVANWFADELKILKRKYCIILVIIISFVFALFGFNSLTKMLETILFFLYPALIAITIANIIDYSFNIKTVKWAFNFACLISLIYNLIF